MAGSSRPSRDLTVLATPFYFVAIAAEARALRRRRATVGPTPGDFEKRDTAASLLMGQLSLVLPLLTRRVTAPLAWGGRMCRGLLGLTVAAAATTVVADAVARRAPQNAAARQVAGATGTTTLALAGLSVTSSWGTHLTPAKLHARSPRAPRANGWGSLFLALVGWDFIYYWNHRFMHSSRYMWSMHVVHHSSEHYNLSTALRQPVAESLTTPIPYGLLCLLGVTPETLETARGINLLYQFWIHTEAVDTMGAAESVLNSPSAHRVHHGSNSRYLDRNHGGILIIWDRLFGTFEPEDDRVIYGLTKNIHTFNPLRIIGHEYVAMARDVARATSWRDRLSHVVRGPGWRATVPLAASERAVLTSTA